MNVQIERGLQPKLFMHQSFEIPDPPPPSGIGGVKAGLSLQIHSILVPR